jgi:hypothetical protein
MPTTLTSTVNYSGLLYTKTDENTRLLDAIYARGRSGGRRETDSVEFVLANSYGLEDPIQPNISETASLTAPDPETVEREQESNVVQIFHRSVAVSYMKQSNTGALGGVNVAGAANNVPSELDFQIGRRVSQMRMDLNYTIINGVYQYTKGSTTVAPRTRGILPAIVTNKFDAASAALSKNMVNDAIMNAIKNGFNPAGIEMWINPDMMDVVTDTYMLLPGTNLPASRTEGGASYSTIMTNYGEIMINWDTQIPTAKIALLSVGELAVAEKPVAFDTPQGISFGALLYEPLAKTGASERGQLYGEFGIDYGAEWHHALIENIGA